MSFQSIEQVFSGFVEAMYFADGADADFKDDDGFYLDGQFNKDYELSNRSRINIKTLLETIAPKLPSSVYELTLDRVGNCIYYHIIGHVTDFSDDLDLSDEDSEYLYQLFFNSVHLEIYDNEDTKEIELSYTENWN